VELQNNREDLKALKKLNGVEKEVEQIGKIAAKCETEFNKEKEKV